MGRLNDQITGVAPRTRVKKADLTTEEGLLRTAEEVGVGERARRVLAEKGEDPEQIFSGGFISDVFDALNLFQFGITGALKGKSFAEGVRTRQSFSDKDALGQFGLPGVLAGIVADIAVDPLTYLAPVSILRRVPGLAKAFQAVRTTARRTAIGRKTGSLFIYRFGQDPIYRTIAERTERNIARGVQNVLELSRPLTKLDPVAQRAIAAARKAGKLADLSPAVLSKARPAFDALDRLGREAVSVGLLKQSTFDENVGTYIARLYRKQEIPEGVIAKVKDIFERKPIRIDVSRFKKRTDIPEDVRRAMGEILEAGYPTAKALVQLTRAVERAKFFREVAGKFAKDTVEVGFKQLPEVRTLGGLSGKAVPTSIFDDIQEIIRAKGPAERHLSRLVATFKFNKVILNPATHARNIMSNFILNDFEGLSPGRLDIYARAAKQITTKGDIYQEARRAGLGLDTFAANELRGLLLGPESRKFSRVLKRAADKVSGLYQKEEEFAKMAQYIFQKGKGLSPDEAYRVAERATFNYAQVTPFVRRVRESLFGFPFITFTVKVTPQVAKTLARRPTKISNIGKIKNAIEKQADLEELKEERATEPGWIREGFFVKLPMKDKFGRSAYFDLTYILPFGDLISGQFIRRDIKRETGLRESIPEAAIERAPFFNFVKEVGSNQDFFGNKIWLESDTTDRQLGDVMRHLAKTFLPPLLSDQIPGGRRPSGERRPGAISRVIRKEFGIEAGGKQTRSFMQELLRQVGLKIQPVDIELQRGFAERERERALQTLLKERGEIREFTRPFIPKERAGPRQRLQAPQR